MKIIIILALLFVGSVHANPSALPYFKVSKLETIQIHEEGEAAAFSRKGYVALSPKIDTVNGVSATTVKKWINFICKNLKSGSEYFVLNGWNTLPASR